MAIGCNTPRTHLSSITAIGAGAALFAVVGYLFLNKKKSKKKQKASSSSSSSTPEQLTNFQNMQAILASSKSFKGHRKSEDQVVPNTNVSSEPCTSKSCDDYDSIDKITNLNETETKLNANDQSICQPIEASSPLIDSYEFFEKKVLSENLSNISENTKEDEPEVQEVTIRLNAEDDEAVAADTKTSSSVKIEESKTKEWTIVEVKAPEATKGIEAAPIIERTKIEESITKELTIVEIKPDAKKESQVVVREELPEVIECSTNEERAESPEIIVPDKLETEVKRAEVEPIVAEITDTKEDVSEPKLEDQKEKSKKEIDDENNTSVNNNNSSNNLEKSSSSSSTTSNASSSASTTVSSSSYTSSRNELEPLTKENLTITKMNANTNSKRPTRSVPKSRAENDSSTVLGKPKAVDSQSFKTKKSAKTTSSSSSNSDVKVREEDSNGTYEDLVVYEFNFPRKFCGKLIGKNGVHVDFIRSKTHTQIAVRNDPNLEDLQIVCVSGRVEDVDHALDIISARFPAKLYPQISFKPISKPIVYRRHNPEKSSLFNETKVLVAPNMYVDLASVIPKNESSGLPNEDDFFEVYVSSVVSAAHVFIQLPSNATYEHLQNLDQAMLTLYNDSRESVPLMVEPIEYGSICAAPTYYGWHRAMVISYMTKSEAEQQIPGYSEACGLATIKFLDYGGYLSVPTNQLRQLRSDFINLPFQAIECYLDGIYPFEGTEEEGKNFLSQMIKNSTLKTKITGYSEDGMPVIKLFSNNNDTFQNLEINSELVNYGYAFYLNQLEQYQKEKINSDGEPQLTPVV